MFASVFRRVSSMRYASKARTIARGFAEAAKEKPKQINVKFYVTLALAGPFGYSLFSYATDERFHEIVDEKVFIHMPWLLTKMNKWFHLTVDYPLALRNVKAPMELKEVLGNSGMVRNDAVEFMSIVFDGIVPTEFVTRLSNGDYLNSCIRSAHHSELKALPGLDRIMSLDEFVAFAADIFRSRSEPINTLVDLVKHALKTYKETTKGKGGDVSDVSETEVTGQYFGLRPMLMPFIHSFIRTRHHIDDAVVNKHVEEEMKKQQKSYRKVELENEVSRIDYDVKLINDELKEAKRSRGIDSKENVKSLNEELSELNRKRKEAKNELYYL